MSPSPYVGPHWLDSVGPGWHGLLRWVHDSFKRHNIAPIYRQVKEKFGSLRIYCELDETVHTPESDDFDQLLNTMNDIIDAAEKASSRMCDQCSQPAKTHNVRNTHWFLTICDECERREVNNQ